MQAMMDQSSQHINQAFKDYKWYNSSSLPFEVQCGISRLEFPIDIKADSTNIPNDLYFTAYIVCNQLRMHETPISTQFCFVDQFRNTLVWDYVLSFPVKARDLSLDSLLVLTAWTPSGQGDGNVIPGQNRTPGELHNYYSKWDYKFRMEKHFEAYKSNVSALHASRQDNQLEWLDRLLLARIQESIGSAALADGGATTNWGCPMEEQDLNTFCFLVVEMPLLQHPVLHEEKQYPTVSPHVPPTSQLELLASCIVDSDDQLVEFSLAGRPFSASMLTIVADWDMDQENLSEEQNRRLSQNARRGAADATAKPNLAERELIDRVVTRVGNHMSVDEIATLYRYRYSLTENKKALTKFLFAVNWDEDSEVAELPLLFSLWKQRAPIDVADALKLLSKEKSFEHPFVREYAVEILRSASDEELLTFLLQLVQALRYEPTPSAPPQAPLSPMPSPAASAPSAVDFGLESSIVGVDHLRVSVPGSSAGAPARPDGISRQASSSGSSQTRPRDESLSPLANFLIDRACNSPTVANFLYWYLKVETEDEQSGNLFQAIFESFIVQLSDSGPEQSRLFKQLCALDDYIAKISLCQNDARVAGKYKAGKEELLRKYLHDRRLARIASGVDYVPMPLDPRIKLVGLNAATATMFASAVYPCVIEFYEYVPPPVAAADGQEDGGQETAAAVSPPRKTHKIMFKSGDDLRQDQLIMQMIALMDRLLKKVNLDLKLLTYGILAVGQKDGIMEFVRNSMAVSGVVKQHGSITEYLRVHNPDKAGPYEIAPRALDTFVKSCAGYCVITYILGIGDRHLDNIMLNTSGQMFHIDFGFIFGQDPKPLPPPFRFTRSMADAMGGEDSEHYGRFKTFCCQSYNWLRKSANLVLNLLSLMGDAGIQDISRRSDLPKVLLKVEEKFRLDLTDEQAEQFFLGLINESLHSIAPRIMETMHKLAVAMR